MNPSDLHLAEALGHDVADKRIDILQRIGSVGSISEAARSAGVSYKAAWQAIETLSNLAGAPLVEKVVGGSGGGGAQLTAAGQRLLTAARWLSDAKAEVMARLESEGHDAVRGPGLAALGLRTSMRNQLPCTVTSWCASGPAIRVTLALAGDTSVVSRVTRESVQLLDLQPGQAVLALCKATAVRVARQLAPCEGHNLLAGRVTRMDVSTTGGEASLQLVGGLHLVGFADPGHELQTGEQAVACVEESALVIAVSF